MDAEGRSTAWNVKWSSKSAGKINMMSVNDGVLTTFELPGPGGRVVPVKPGTTLWHVSYSGDDYRELFHVAIEGETGKLKVLSD